MDGSSKFRKCCNLAIIAVSLTYYRPMVHLIDNPNMEQISPTVLKNQPTETLDACFRDYT